MNKTVPCPDPDPDSSLISTSGASGRLLGSFFQHFIVRDHIWWVKCGWMGFSGRKSLASRRITCSSQCESNGSFLVKI
jgi:hypothetical protein